MGDHDGDGSIDRLRAAVAAALSDPEGDSEPLRRVCMACTDLLPVDGASVSVMTGTQYRETLYASDDMMSVVESLQFTLGEGPCFDAFLHRRPVLVPDLATYSTTAWPVFASEIAAYPIGAIFAFPLQAGAIAIGAMDLYRRKAGWLTTAELATALQVVDLAALAVLGLRYGLHEGEWLADLPHNREVVHQAVGMLIAEYRIPPDQALARLRGYAFAAGRTVEDVATDLTTRRMHPAAIPQ
jgi:ANTAR domain-containing protein/GAF domain-containing protein